jgi:xeroderma pigmentosum group C-complementing protein
VGFDVRDGRPVPKFDGVVVCVEHAEVLREAAAAMAEQAEDKEVHKQHAEALSLWRALIRALAIRRRLEEQYGDS